MSASNSTKEIIQSLVHRAKEAQKKFEKYNQEQVDEVVTAVAWALCNPSTNKLISNLAVDSTGLGNAEDKISKNKRKTLGLLRDLKDVKTVGVISEDKQKGIIEIAKPVGIVGAVTPATNPAATPVNNILKVVEVFFDIHKSENTIASGVHFEMTGQEVTECTGGAQEISDEKLGDRYRTHCDPRLNASQALEMAFLTAEALKKIREEKNQEKNIIANN